MAMLAALALCLSSPAGAVAAPTWLAPEQLTDAGQIAYAPAIAAAPDGTVLAVWARTDGANIRIEVRIRPPGGEFGPAERLSAPGSDALGPAVAFDARGEAIVAWERAGRVEATRRPPGGEFGPTKVVSDESESSSQPAVVFASEGDAVIAWTGQSGTPPSWSYRMWARAWGAGGLGAAQQLAAASTSDSHETAGFRSIQLAADGQGDAFAIWLYFVQTAPTMIEPLGSYSSSIGAAARPAGSSFALPATTLDSGEESGLLGARVESPSIVADRDGNALAVWSRREGGQQLIEAKARPAGGSFEAGAENVYGPASAAFEPSVALDGDGNAVAVWQSQVGGKVGVLEAERPAGGSFGGPRVLSEPGTSATAPTLAVTARGEALVGWVRGGATSQVEATARPPGGDFGDPLPLSPPAGEIDLTDPTLAVDGQGNAVALWRLLKGGYVVEVAGYDAAGPVLSGLELPATGTTGSPLAFSVTPLDVWSPPASATWYFGDGATAPGAAAVHAYAKPGDYRATVTGADALGNISSASGAISITGSSRHERGTASAARVAWVKRGRAQLRMRCHGAGRCQGVVKLRFRRKRGKALLLGKARFGIATHKRKTVPVKLSRRAKGLLRRAGRRGLEAQLRGSGVKRSTVVLKRAHRHRHKR